jgi:hypothetical protein
VLEERKAAMLGEVLEAKRLLVHEARRTAGGLAGPAPAAGAAAVRRSSKQDQLPLLQSRAGAADATK